MVDQEDKYFPYNTHTIQGTDYQGIYLLGSFMKGRPSSVKEYIIFAIFPFRQPFNRCSLSCDCHAMWMEYRDQQDALELVYLTGGR